MSAAWTCNGIGVPTCNYRALFLYNLSNIPSNATVVSAKLYLYAQTNSALGSPGNPTYGSANTSLLQEITAPWSATGTGWANQPTTDATTQITLAQSTSEQQNYVVDLSSFVQGWINNPSSNYGMMLRLSAENYYNSMIFNSGAAPDSLQPTLQLCLVESTDSCISIKGDTASSTFKQIEIQSYTDSTGDTTEGELMSAAWTCNGIGIPTCNYRALFKYDLSSIPSSATVTSANLYLYAQTNSGLGNPGNPTFGSANTSLLQEITAPWTVGGTGWANQPTTDAATQITLAQSTSEQQNYVVDVSSFVQGWITNPSTNYGMMLRLNAENYYNSMIFNSGQAPDSLKPTLQICISKSSLPVLLVNFRGAAANNVANLTWAITDGATLSSIVLEKSPDGNTFSTVKTIAAQNYAGQSNYQYADANTTSLTKAFYRLKLFTKDGHFTYSNTLLISFASGNNGINLQVLPNPALDNIQLLFQAESESNTSIAIINSLGQTLALQNIQIAKGSNSIALNSISNLAKGLYIVRLIVDGQVVSKKFIKE